MSNVQVMNMTTSIAGIALDIITKTLFLGVILLIYALIIAVALFEEGDGK